MFEYSTSRHLSHSNNTLIKIQVDELFEYRTFLIEWTVRMLYYYILFYLFDWSHVFRRVHAFSTVSKWDIFGSE